MKRILTLFLIFLTGFNIAHAENKKDYSEMKIKLILDNNQEVIINMAENSAVEQFLEMLPAHFNFSDFAGEEKITQFPKPISLEKAPRGMIATAGKMFIYAPWKNLGIFYKTHSLVPDKDLIELGEVEIGLDFLVHQPRNFSAQIEVMK